MPTILLLAAATFFILFLKDSSSWIEMLLFCVNVFLLRELNHRNTLIRQNAGMITGMFITLRLLCPGILSETRILLFQTSMLLSMLFFFQTYQQQDSQGVKYYAYLFLGIATMLWPQAFLLVPFLLLSEKVHMSSFNIGSLWACLLGILTPYWLALPFVYFYGMEFFSGLLDSYHDTLTSLRAIYPQPFYHDFLSLLPFPLTLSAAILLLMLLLCAIHYFRFSYTDKIQVRMNYSYLLLLSVVMVVMTGLPDFCTLLSTDSVSFAFSVVICCATPLLVRCLNHVSSRVGNVLVYLFTSIVAACVLYNISLVWMD